MKQKTGIGSNRKKALRIVLAAAILLTALYSIGGLSRVVRSAFREEMGKSYVKFMVSRGFEPKSVLWKHAYKPPLASLIYNGTYLIPEVVICILLAVFVAKPVMKIMKSA